MRDVSASKQFGLIENYQHPQIAHLGIGNSKSLDYMALWKLYTL